MCPQAGLSRPHFPRPAVQPGADLRIEKESGYLGERCIHTGNVKGFDDREIIVLKKTQQCFIHVSAFSWPKREYEYKLSKR